ncbi:serine/threonine-protein kinase [Marinicella meishanensis]|uniref:serine/threonine-protein kinase n=1 Tax=Marinicella meishanensis TaxID=2873263 RepID=UPI001CC06B13|nr:serine/threonine-protein kinase [Marinicella sp. NBU2979]
MSENENNRTDSADPDWDLQWDLFDQIINAAADQQDQKLAEISARHPDLTDSLKALLDSHRTASSVLDEPVAGLDLSDEPAIPQQIGGYEIIRPLGAGGLGDVYLARKAEEDFEHLVALKMAPSGRYSSMVLNSFNNELRMLLSLNHPHIERLYEGGVSADNIPYLVVEYIDGQHIDQYCDQARLSVKQRIRLFVQICEAVATLHQSLIIHRDIKPSNIMVDHSGTAKLLDFGLAKLEDLDASEEVTVSGYMMTLAYASPEQIRGQTITTASDVYSLGLLLYYLLSGQLPYQIKNNDLAEASRQITEKVPPLASQNILASAVINQQQGQLRKQLSGELDAILAKAIHKDPERRYASAQQLADDLGRYLNHHPIKARPDRIGYRIKKFTQRHTAGVVVSILFLGSLLLLTGLLFKRSEELSAALLATQQEQQRVSAVTNFLVDVFKVSDPLLNQSDIVNVKDLLDYSTQQLHQQFNQEPATKARLYETLGLVYLNMSDVTQAESLLDQAAALAYDKQPHEALATAMVQAELLLRKGDLGPALGLLEQFHQQHPQANIDVSTAMKLGLLTGTLQYQLGRSDAAIATLTQAEQTLNQQQPDSGLFKLQQLQADINHLLGNVYWSTGDFAQVAVHYQRAYNSNLARLGPDHHSTLKSLSALGVLDYAQGQFEPALSKLSQVVQSRQAHLGNDHFLTADAHNRLGATHYELGDLKAAVAHYDLALQGFEASGLKDSVKYTRVLNNLGLVKRLQNESAAAAALFSEALRIQTQMLGEGHPELGAMMHNLGLTAYDQGQYAQALDWFTQSYTAQHNAHQLSHVRIAYAITNMARMQVFLGQFDEAKGWLETALKLRTEQLGEDHLLTAVTWMVQAEWGLANDQLELALEAAQQALRIRSAQLPETDQRVVYAQLFVDSMTATQPEQQRATACLLRPLKAEMGAEHPTYQALQARLPAVSAADCPESESDQPVSPTQRL